jgi:hypothetical protein
MNNQIKNQIYEHLQILKPRISNSTLTTYSHLLYRLYYNIHDKSEPFEFHFFGQESNIITYLEKIDPKTRKTILASLIAASPDKCSLYKKLMINDIKTMKDIIDTNTKSDSQSKLWITLPELKKIYNKLYKKISVINIDDVSIDEQQTFQDLIIIMLTSGLFIPPRRSLDVTEFKIRNIDKKKDNYLSDDTLIYNKYKTKDTYGEQQVKVDNKDFIDTLNYYIKYINKNDYLLVNRKGNKLNDITLNQRIKKICNNLGGINIFRHLYITNMYDQIPDIKKISEQMGHSIDTQLTYIKK